MINFIMKNKLQFTTVVFTNLVTFMFIIYIIALKLLDEVGMMSIIFGVFVTFIFAINIKKYAKVYRLKILVIYVLFIIIIRYISTLFLSPEDVLSGTGIFIGFLSYALVANILETINNIKNKIALK